MKEKKENEAIEGEEKNEKKAKKEKKENSLPVPLPLLICGVVGIVILITLSVIIGSIVANNFLSPHQGNGTETVESGKKGEKKKKIPTDEEESDAPFVDDMFSFETGKITTNTKGASNIYVVVELSVDFKPYDAEDEKMQALINEKGEINKESSLYNKLKVQITAQITNILASYTEPELQAVRNDLNNIIRTQLKPIFRKFELKLGDVHVVTFLVQQM